MLLNFNPNAACSEVIEREFNSSISTGIDVCIVAQDDTSITLGKWRFDSPFPKEFTLTQRTAGVGRCVGGYLKKEHTEKFNLQGKKCFIEITGSLRTGKTIKLALAGAAMRMPNKDVAMVSFDPAYKSE